MNRYIPVTLLFISIFTSVALAQKEGATEPVKAGKSILVSITATVESINPEKREMTLKGPLGNSVTFVVDKRVQRFNEIKTGDNVTADYYVSVAFELREPTAEEKAAPLVVLDELAKAPAGTDPAGGGLHQIKVVTTVEGLDLPTQTLTLKGPRGNYATIRAEDTDKLKKLRLGDTIVVTYAEALAVSLEKVPSKKG